MASLAERLKSETQALHRAAERSAFMSALLRGELDRESYCALLGNLHAIYAALEPALLRHAAHPLIAPVLLPPLWRTAALAADLRALQGGAGAVAFELQPACVRYLGRIHQLDATQPGLLLAHAYVRYLGDLSGGQLLRGIVAASLKPPAGTGTAFYEFGAPAETLALTHAFRSGLNEVVVDAAGADALVAEARLAFELHRSLFDELTLERDAADHSTARGVRASSASSAS